MKVLAGSPLPEMSFRGPNHGPRSEAEREGRGIPQTLSGKMCLAPEDNFWLYAWGIPLSPLALLGARFAEHPGGAE